MTRDQQTNMSESTFQQCLWAEFIAQRMSKPVTAFIAGRTAPEGKRMGHAGAIVAGGRGTIESKLRAFAQASIPVAAVPNDVVGLVRDALSRA